MAPTWAGPGLFSFLLSFDSKNGVSNANNLESVSNLCEHVIKIYFSNPWMTHDKRVNSPGNGDHNGDQHCRQNEF